MEVSVQVKMSESVNLTVYYGPGNVRYDESGVDLSEYKKCVMTLPDPDRLDIRQLKYWLTTSFGLDPEVCSVSIQAVWTKSCKNVKWELMLIDRSQKWLTLLRRCRDRKIHPYALVQPVAKEENTGQPEGGYEPGQGSQVANEIYLSGSQSMDMDASQPEEEPDYVPHNLCGNDTGQSSRSVILAGSGDYTQADPPESQTVAPVPSQASLQMSKEVEAEANLVILSAEPIVAPAQLLQREAEQVDRSGITPAAQTLPSASREVSTPTDLIIQSAQPSMAPTVLSQRDVEQSSLLSRVPSSQCLPSVPLSSIPLQRTSPDQCQPSHQPEAAPGSSAQLFLGASMMFNHPPVGDEPLKNELHRLRLYIDSLNKTHKLKQSQLRTECRQEIEKVKQKYDSLLQEHDSTHLQQRKTLDKLCEKVVLNQSLADDFRAKFISSSAAQARAHSPPNNQRPQPSQQVPTRPSAVASTASLTAGRPTVPINHVQPLQVDQPSPSSSPSSQVARNNIVRSTSPTSSLAPVLSRGRFGVHSELARAPAHLQHRLPAQVVHSMASGNQQQLPTRLDSMSARTWSTPVTPINIRQSCPQTVPPGNTSPSSLHPSSHPSIPAPLGPSSSHQIQQVPPLPSSSQPTPLPSPVSSIPNPVLPLTSPRGLTTTSSVASAASNVLPSRSVGPSASGMPPSDSDSVSLDEWLTGNLGLRNDPPGMAARVDVVCLSDDEETDD